MINLQITIKEQEDKVSLLKSSEIRIFNISKPNPNPKYSILEQKLSAKIRKLKYLKKT